MEKPQVSFSALSDKARALVLKSQKDEQMGAQLYAFMARREKKPENRALLEQMAQDEAAHAAVWQSVSGQKTRPSRLRIGWLKLVTVLLGFTFTLKLLHRDEIAAIAQYETMKDELPDASRVQGDEMRHERQLIDMLDEERLQYVGAMVLGLNDALVELTGTIAGLSFAMQNTRLVALSGSITGITASLFMEASNFLAERANGNPNALKCCLYTGVAYVVTVVLLVLPYLLLPNSLWLAALITMLAVVVLIILFFNYYLSVAKDLPFARRFGEMCLISLGVAAIAFVIGLAAKALLGVDVG